MKKEKLELGLKEVLDEINTALKDSRGLVSHQRRLAFSLSLGASILLELYLQNLDVIKEGAKINHLWFKKKKENTLKILQNQIVPPIDSVKDIKNITDLIINIESKRDEIAYGSPVSEEILQKKINLFFKLKEMVKC